MFAGAIGEFAIGQFRRSFTLGIEAGAYTVSGQDIGFSTGGDTPIAIDQGSYTVTGHDITLTKQHRLDFGLGTYNLAGQDITFDVGGNQTIEFELGVYTITGLAPILAGRSERDNWSVSVSCTIPGSVTVETN